MGVAWMLTCSCGCGYNGGVLFTHVGVAWI